MGSIEPAARRRLPPNAPAAPGSRTIGGGVGHDRWDARDQRSNRVSADAIRSMGSVESRAREAIMEGQFIDRLTKLLGATPNRRITLGLAASTAFGVLTGLLELDEAEAGKKKKGGKKKGKKGK